MKAKAVEEAKIFKAIEQAPYPGDYKPLSEKEFQKRKAEQLKGIERKLSATRVSKETQKLGKPAALVKEAERVNGNYSPPTR